MKNKDIEKMIRSSAQPDKKAIWQKIESRVAPSNAPVEAVADTGRGNVAIKSKKPIIYTVVAFFLAVAVLLSTVLPIALKNKNNFNYSGSFFIDINPSIQVLLDKDGNVKEVSPLNDDAVILLQGKKSGSFIGKKGEDVAAEIWRLAYGAGYVNPNKKDNAILITGGLNNEKLNKDYSTKVKAKITNEIKSNGVFCVVLTEKLNSNLQIEAQKYNVSTSKYQLILTAKRLGANILESEYQTITVAQINARISSLGEQIENFGSNYSKQLEQIEDYIEEVAEQLIEQIEGAVETLENLTENSLFAEYYEQKIEELEEILDELEDKLEDGKNSKPLFERLSLAVEELGQEFSAQVALIKDIIQEVEEKYEQLTNDALQTKAQIIAKFNEYFESASATNSNYVKPESYEQEYEEWLEEIYDDYYNGWEEKKNSWHHHDD